MQTLRLDQVCKRFGEKVVLDRMSYTAPATGLVWIYGPSGSGKTTLLRLIAGLDQPDSGSIYLPEGARLSMVFQEDRLLPTLDARGNILAVIGRADAASRALADEYLARCGLAGEEHRFPAELSGGMRRRVAIARAMAYHGNILLLDEPFKGLDDALKQQVMDFVLADRSRLTLLVTHDRAEAVSADDCLSLT